MAMRGIRGAATVEHNEKEEIWQAAVEMVEKILAGNELQTEDIGAAIFTMTEDLTAAFPTAGVRQRVAGFDMVPLFDARQCAIEGSLEKCIRLLLLVDIDKAQKDIKHVYLGRAAQLRPDLQQKN